MIVRIAVQSFRVIERRLEASRDRLAEDEDGAGRVLEHVGDGRAESEVAAAPLAVREAPAMITSASRDDGLIHERGADVARLEQLGLAS